MTGGLSDSRTPYWLPAKWVAKLRDLKTDDNPLLLRMEMASGHLGVSGFDDFNRESARLYAFVLQELGIANVEPSPTAAVISAPQAAKWSAEPVQAVQMTSHRLPSHLHLSGATDDLTNGPHMVEHAGDDPSNRCGMARSSRMVSTCAQHRPMGATRPGL